ncbi:MAG: hypothetical protein WCL22_03375 [bacterium]
MDHWQESDGAADFVFVYKEATTMAKRRKIIDTELKDFANNYNTPGSVNIALAMEDGIVRKDDMTETQRYRLRDMLHELKDASSAKFKENWEDEGTRIEHNNAYKRLLKHVNKNLI